ncbi:MAG: HAD hydrolase family protein, partial [Chloroflexota bacterium]|nr:HAD hydrolase family protein [Chloroflexota bacterium]
MIDAANDITWSAAMRELEDARALLGSAHAGITRQRVYTRWLDAQSRSTALLHGWWAQTLDLEPVSEPRLVFSLDVDGVLEDEGAGFSSTGAAGAAALRLLQLGGVAVLLNTARSLRGVRERVGTFRLLGGVSSFGAAYWDGVYAQEASLLSNRGADQLTALRAILRADPELVQDGHYQHSVRVSRIVDGAPCPLAGPDARHLLQRHSLTDLTVWVAPEHTDFVDRSVDKGTGLLRLLDELRLGDLPIAAMGDAACDIPMLRLSTYAFLPAATLPMYVPPR